MADNDMADNATPPPPIVDYFWRPGCPFCARLEHDLNQAGVEIKRHNIWQDPEAAETVRALANGNETVPTVRIGDIGLVNPPIAKVLEVLRESA